MKKINEILKDNSLNDRLLIKELSIYIKNHKLNKKKIDGNFVRDIINIITSNEEAIIDNIIFVDDDSFLGCYYDKEIEINLTAINNLKYYYSNLNMEIMAYYEVLFVIVHELTHAKQHYLIENGKHNVYNSSFEYVDNYYSNYEINHDLTPTERYADARGIYIAYQVLSYIYPEEKLLYIKNEFFENLIKEYCYCFYCDEGNDILDEEILDGDIQSPISQFNEIINGTKIEKVCIDDSDINLFEKIYLGLDISTEEYNYFIENMDNFSLKKEKKLTKSKDNC